MKREKPLSLRKTLRQLSVLSASEVNALGHAPSGLADIHHASYLNDTAKSALHHIRRLQRKGK